MLMMNLFSPISFEKPPTLYSILNSIVNFGKTKEEQKKISELSKYGRNVIFDFEYPLSSKVNKEDFETLILNHFMMRRIGFETPTAFKLALNVKLNEIMPTYNKLLDVLTDWNIFEDGESIERTQEDEASSSVNSSTQDSNTSDRRYSNLPQGKLENVRDGDYITDYNFDKNDGSGSSRSVGNNNSTTTEKIKRSPADKIRIYNEFIENKNNIYSMIFEELDSLFYQLI